MASYPYIDCQQGTSDVTTQPSQVDLTDRVTPKIIHIDYMMYNDVWINTGCIAIQGGVHARSTQEAITLFHIYIQCT